MRASTMFALTLALLTGLGAVVAARYAGWLGKVEPPAPKKEEVQILVAARNLFPGDVIDSAWVKTRALKPEEKKDYDEHRREFLPATPAAAALRVASKAIEADAPILRKDLKEMVKPEPLHQRLLPNMRAVNVSVPKDQSAGGLIQVGEWVDVYLTSAVGHSGQETTRTAPVVQSVRVIAKRNALWQIFAGLPEKKPVDFTLEANPYRAGLIEFSKTKGTLSLVPLSAAEQRVLEDRRNKLLAQAVPAEKSKPVDAKILPVSFAKRGSGDSGGEESRVDSFNRGEYTISHQDLVRIFDLTTPPPPRSNVVIEQFHGQHLTRISHFDADGQFLRSEDPKMLRGASWSRATAKGAAAPAEFTFGVPSAGGCSAPRKK